MWKIGAFCGGFLGKNPLDFVEFFAADGDEIFAGAVGADGSGKAPCSIMRSSEMHKSQADAIIKQVVFSRTILPPHLSAGFCLFEVRGVVVWALSDMSHLG